MSQSSPVIFNKLVCMLLWRCYLTPHPTITVQFVLTLPLASLLMVMGAGVGMMGCPW